MAVTADDEIEAGIHYVVRGAALVLAWRQIVFPPQCTNAITSRAPAARAWATCCRKSACP
jgi:hypothetical protein